MKHCVTFVSILAVAVTLAPLDAEEPNETAAAQEVRDILNDVWDKLESADPGHHDHFSEDMMRISANGPPVDWSITSTSLPSKEVFIEWARGAAEKWSDRADWQKSREILHVDVNGNRALVTARQSFSMPDSTKHLTVNNSFSEVILFRRVEQQWKLTHSLVMDYEQIIWHWDPE